MLTTLLALVLTAQAGFEASSTKKDSRFGATAFAAPSAVDSNPDTCWQSDPEKDNKGQWIALDIPISTVDKVALQIGWDKSDEAFKDHARVKSGKVTFYNKGMGDTVQVAERPVTFKDERGWQIIDIEDVKIDGILGGTARLTIDEFYPGVDFPNLAVSEIRIHLKEFPAETIAISGTEGADEAEVPENMLDNSSKTIFKIKEQKDEIALTAKGYGLASLGLEAGPPTHARPKTVLIKADNNEIRHTIDEKAKGIQWVLLPAIIGYTGSAAGDVVVVIEDSWPGTVATNPLALAEVKLNATVIEEF